LVGYREPSPKLAVVLFKSSVFLPVPAVSIGSGGALLREPGLGALVFTSFPVLVSS